MYASFFGLKHEPFSIAPDPRYLFMSERHREALAHLLYGVTGGGGFVLLSGEIGAGKTTVCRCFLEQIPRRCNVAYIFNPKLTVLELLQSVCEEFGIPNPKPSVRGAAPTVKDYLDPLNQFLLKTHAVGQNNVLVIDEAQMLSADVLEQLRLLTNLETSERKLLQIILIGQPELRDLLARPELEQLAQRVIARYHLGALTEIETEQYMRHRLAVAGMTTAMPFDAKAILRIHQRSRGVPRRINLLCDRALLGAYALGKGTVDRDIVDQAAAEVFDREIPAPLSRPARGWRGDSKAAWALGVGLAAAIVVAGAAWLFTGRDGPSAGSLDAVAKAASGQPAGAASGGSAQSRRAAMTAAQASGASAAVASMQAGHAASGASSAPEVAHTAARAAAQAAPLAAADLSTRFPLAAHTEKQAWEALAPDWKLALDAADPCKSAQRADVPCFRSTGSTLALIRQLDRPGIVLLRDAANRPVYALLTGLTAQTATLRFGDVSQTVSLDTLGTLWRGDFSTLWRAPPGYVGRIVDSSSGTVAAWTALQLARLRGETDPPAEALTDAGWRARVSAFQLAHGLKADGRAGPTTFMQLNRAIGIDEPRLRAEPPARPAV